MAKKFIPHHVSMINHITKELKKLRFDNSPSKGCQQCHFGEYVGCYAAQDLTRKEFGNGCGIGFGVWVLKDKEDK